MGRKLRLKLVTIPWALDVPTLSLASLAAVTPEDRFEICIVDTMRERLLLDEPTDLVGITASTPRIKAAYALADFYRHRGTTVVIGGHHVSALPEEGLEHADAVVCGEGENSWMRICDQMLIDPRSVSGIYKDDPPDLAHLPLPRVDLMKIHRYSWAPYYYPIVASRGCSMACSFCFAKRMTHGYRTHPIYYVVEQLRSRPAWVKQVYFVDDNLAGDVDYARELFRELAKLEISFAMQVRHEFGQDPEKVRWAREAGCVLISSGYESVHQPSLDNTGKRANATLYKESIANIQREGILASGNWMFGFDWDAPDLFEKTWEFLRESQIYHSSFTAEIPFPGTPAHRRYLHEGRMLTTDYDAFVGKDRVVHRPRQMTPEQLQKGIRWLALRYYSVSHRRHLARKGMENPKLLTQFSGWKRRPILALFNYSQACVWHYRMTPSLNWLYNRLIHFNKYRFILDLARGTNYWAAPFEPASQAPAELTTASPFAHAAGEMVPGGSRLMPAPSGATAGRTGGLTRISHKVA